MATYCEFCQKIYPGTTTQCPHCRGYTTTDQISVHDLINRGYTNEGAPVESDPVTIKTYEPKNTKTNTNTQPKSTNINDELFVGNTTSNNNTNTNTNTNTRSHDPLPTNLPTLDSNTHENQERDRLRRRMRREQMMDEIRDLPWHIIVYIGIAIVGLWLLFTLIRALPAILSLLWSIISGSLYYIIVLAIVIWIFRAITGL